MSMERILVVDDDKKITRILKLQLSNSGYDVLVGHSGKEAVEIALQEQPNLVLMDIAMPEMDGVEAMKKIKEKLRIPVVLLTARDATSDIVEGFDTGADEYITKPFIFDELLARLRARLRQYQSSDTLPAHSKTIEYKGIHMDTSNYTVSILGEPSNFSKTEFNLLSYLLKKRGTVVSRDELLEEVWGYSYGGSNNVDVYVNYIRKKIAKHLNEEIVETIRGRGYIVK